MVITSNRCPRLPRMFWGEVIYATPGSGKTFVANKYRDVVDADDLMVEAIEELTPNFNIESYDDPRQVIFRYFAYIKFKRFWMNKCYAIAKKKMKYHTNQRDVVLCGSMDLMYYADRIFIENDTDIVRSGFESKQDREREYADGINVPTHFIDGYLEPALHKLARGH
eukprot:GSMAST32.ASY1.ANO1.2455.1 assembled CDS